MHMKILDDEGRSGLNKSPKDLFHFDGDSCIDYKEAKNSKFAPGQPYARTQSLITSKTPKNRSLFNKIETKVEDFKKAKRLESFMNLADEDSATLRKENKANKAIYDDIEVNDRTFK
uniref:Uncharacterized protein n=1 Tax=Euplotes harpa TaxID=151035 RepID=A0A7S3NG35_9SPIT|mmetsp:Transcript_42232/g.49101  ORF Transcript_42232/g.49101 Transcript_42232/m.49101 type:complete len:117 (+) Transcript_42232:1065-1415(+)